MEKEDKTLEECLNSVEIVTSRLLESVLRCNLLASASNPEVQELFQEWLDTLGNHIITTHKDALMLDIKCEAEKIGLSRSAYVSLLTALHRQGKISITHIQIDHTDNGELCDCFK